MKIIFQVLVILAVATLIGGAMYAAVNAGGNMAQMRSGEFDGQQPTPPNGEEFHRPDGERDFQGGITLPFGIIKSLVVIGIVAAFYFNASKWWINRKKRAALSG